ADQLAEVDEPLHVRDAVIATGVMDLEIVAARPAGADRLYPEHADALPGEPGGRFLRQARKVRQVALRAVASPEEIHIEEDGVLGPDGDLRSNDSLLKICDRDVRFEGLVREVKADRLGEKGLKRHLVDGLGTGPSIKVARGIDMGARMIAHGKGE